MAPSQRRRSVDSSSSSSESEFTPYTRDKKDATGDAQLVDPTARSHHMSDEPGHLPPPPSYSPPSTSTSTSAVQPVPQGPPSGYRIPLGMPAVPPSSPSSSYPSFPGIEKTREAPFTDSDGRSPVFIGSALMQDSVHPCKIVPSFRNEPCRVSYGGREIAHEGRYDLLPFVPALMEFVPTSNGHVPHGRMPVKGGFEQNGSELYHAVAVIDGVKVPGKTGIHLVRATFFVFVLDKYISF